MHFKEINNGSPRITRPSSRSRIYVRTAGDNLPSTSCLSYLLLRKGVSCTHTLPSGSRHLSLQSSPCKWSLGQENAPEDLGGRWLHPFLPTEEVGWNLDTQWRSYYALHWPKTPLQNCQNSKWGVQLSNGQRITPHPFYWSFRVCFLLLFGVKGFLIKIHS